MREQEAFELSVVEQVAAHAPISFDEFARRFGSHTWNRLFAAADRLSREGALAIRRVERGTYLITLGRAVDGRSPDARPSGRVLS